MPRQHPRQRIVYCDCYDCSDTRPEPVAASDEALAAAEAVARQLPPPKALLIICSGFVCSLDGSVNLDQCTLPHLDRVVREGAVGLLALRDATSKGMLQPGVAELSQLLEVYDVNEVFMSIYEPHNAACQLLCSAKRTKLLEVCDKATACVPVTSEGSSTLSSGKLVECLQSAQLPQLQARYPNLQALFASCSEPARALAQAVGMSAPDSIQLIPSESGYHPRCAQGAAPQSADAEGAEFQPATASSQGPQSGTPASQPAVSKPGSATSPQDGLQQGSRQGQDGITWRTLGLPDPAAYGTALLEALGAQEGSTGADLAAVHLDLPHWLHLLDSTHHQQQQSQDQPKAETHSDLYDASLAALEWLDSLVKHLLAQQVVRERVLLTLVLTPQGALLDSSASQAQQPGQGGVQHQPLQQQQQQQQRQQLSQGRQAAMLHGGEVLDPNAFVVTPKSSMMSEVLQVTGTSKATPGTTGPLGLLTTGPPLVVPHIPRPVQSWQQLAGKPVAATGAASPALVVRRLPGVVRRDRAERLTLGEADARGGGGAMLIDRLLPELAYKLGAAPKYGA